MSNDSLNLENKADHFFDARDLICPIPVLRARKILLSMKMGEHLEIHVTDKSAPNDFKEFCLDMGYEMVSERKISETVTSIIVLVVTSKSDRS